MKKRILSLAFIAAAISVFAIGGCAKRETAGDAKGAPAGADASGAGAAFATPEEAVTALIAALEKNDHAELRRILGAVGDEVLSSGDEVADNADRESFLARYRTKNELVAGSKSDLVLQVGEDRWPLPFPLRGDGGQWRFDGPAGQVELLMRRIGGNELRTIDVMRGFVAAQEEYASAAHDGVPRGAYAQKMRSDPGKQNGLYWEAAEGGEQSPAGPFLAAASAEGYEKSESGSAPYHGYVYRMLFAQGAAANGGAKDYMVKGSLTGGFAAIARPESYGASGVMTFLVNQDGVVWQKDLGENTTELAAAIQSFDPDASWTPIAPEE